MPRSRLTRSERREQILDAVLDVVLEYGMAVTSKQLAGAAGVSEGTIFKSFGTKEALLREVANRNSLRPDGVSSWLATIDPAAMSLEELVQGIMDVAVDEYRISFAIFTALGPLIDNPTKADIERFEAELRPWADALREHVPALRLDPLAAASVLRMHAIAAADTSSAWSTNMSAADHASVYLYGVATGAPTR